MIRALVLVLFFSVSYFTNGQIKKKDIEGRWVKFKAVRQDGSNIINRFQHGQSYMEINLDKDNYCVQKGPLEKDCLSYKIKNNILEAGNFIKFKITHFKNNLLVLDEIDPNLTKEYLNRYYFLPKEDMSKRYPSEIIDGIAVTNKYTCPLFKDSFRNYISNRIKGNYTTTNFKGYFDIDHNSKSISTNILEDEKTRKETLEIVKRAINNSYNLWEYQKIHDKIRVYFICQTIVSGQFSSFNLKINTQKYHIPNIKKSKDITPNIKDASRYFSKGLRNYKNGKYELANKYFTKSYELDPTQIDALYNRALTFYEIGEKEKACSDWYKLKELGQKTGEKYYRDFCKELTLKNETSQ